MFLSFPRRSLFSNKINAGTPILGFVGIKVMRGSISDECNRVSSVSKSRLRAPA